MIHLGSVHKYSGVGGGGQPIKRGITKSAFRQITPIVTLLALTAKVVVGTPPFSAARHDGRIK